MILEAHFDPNHISQVVDEMNLRFAVIEQPTFLILEEEGKGVFALDKKQSFRDRFANQLVELPNGKKKSKADLFLESPKRRTYHKIVMNPRQEGHYVQNGAPCYNLWQGFAVKATQGCCERFKEHIKDVLCGDNETTYAYVLNLLANWVQKPEERTVAILMRGPQGCGKTIFADAIGKLFGAAYAVYDDAERLLGRFNLELASTLLIFLDEALWGGRKSDNGKLKAAITGNTTWVEGKGKDKIELPNYRKFIAASNERFALPLDADDRRWLVLECSARRVSDSRYFSDISAELSNGGYQALLYELQERDITGFNPRRLPTNDHAFDLKLQSSSSFIQYLHACMYEERFILNSANGLPWTEQELTIRTDILRDYYRDFCTKEKLPLQEEKTCGWQLKHLFQGTRFRRGRPRFNGIRHPAYTLPPLHQAKKCLTAHFHVADVETIFPRDDTANKPLGITGPIGTTHSVEMSRTQDKIRPCRDK